MTPDDLTHSLPPADATRDQSDAALDAGLAAAFGGDTTHLRPPSADPEAGTVIAGKYKLTEKVGEGGMGSVWVASQTEPVKRKVAIKLIKAGMDSKAVLARFDAERQALAVMDHPNIAKVLDGGLHDGRPYFVMELVKGVTITTFCDERKLTPAQRLELFVPVCQAIQHAHQKGVIHRDIKPSNVLVALYDDRPVVKVIDFGIAKATGAALTEHTLDTGIGAVVGTPAYMSPEQASLNNLDIDTRSDVYALGVLLYELLTGSPPFSGKELQKKGVLEMLRVVREEEPPRPSHKLSTADALPSLSTNRGTEPKKLTGLLRNELDWIVMKALEKDRTRRYETANGFAADVNRYLSGEAVQAHPPSAGYRLKKFVRRHRGQVLAASLVLLALVGGMAGTTFGLIQAWEAKERESARADGERQAKEVAVEAEARAISEKKKAVEFRDQALNALRATTGEDVVKLIGEKNELTQNERDYLEAIARRWQGFALSRDNDILTRAYRAEGHGKVADLWFKLGRTEDARVELQSALDLQKLLARENPSVPIFREALANTHQRMGSLLGAIGASEEARQHYRMSGDMFKALIKDDPNQPTYQRQLAGIHMNNAVLLREVWHDLAYSEANSGRPVVSRARWEEATAEYQLALELQKKLAGRFPDDTEYQAFLAKTQHNFAGHLMLVPGRIEQAQTEFESARDAQTKLAERFPNSPEYTLDLATTHSGLGKFFSDQELRGKAEPEYKRAIELLRTLVRRYPAVPAYQITLAAVLNNYGHLLENPGESLVWYDQAIEILQPLLAKESRDVAVRQYLRNCHWNRGIAKGQLGKHAEVLKDWDRAIELSPPQAQRNMRASRAIPRVASGMVAEGVADAAELTKSGDWDSDQWYNFACVYSLASVKLADKKQEYADRAMELLAKAVKAGFKDADQMKTDSDLAPLREREDFKKLLADLEAKFPPKKDGK